MPNKNKMAIIIAGVLLIGIVAASGLISNLGKIVGEVNVNPPVLYLDSNNYSLNLNQFPNTEKDFNLTGNETNVTFYAPSLNVSNLYKTEFNISLGVKTQDTDDDSSFVNVKIIKFYNDSETLICETNIPVHNGTNFMQRYGSCSSSDEIPFNENETLKVVLRGVNDSITYQFRTGGNTYDKNVARVELWKI